MYIYICIYVRVQMYMYMCMCIYICVIIFFVYISKYIYIYTHLCVYIYTHYRQMVTSRIGELRRHRSKWIQARQHGPPSRRVASPPRIPSMVKTLRL